MNRLHSHLAPSKGPQALRTDCQGRVTLNCDPILPFKLASERFETLFLQTRHNYARLVSIFQDNPLRWIEDGKIAATADTRLIYRPNDKSTQTALLKYCDCCKSPGRIEFRDTRAQECLQLCAAQDIEIESWSHLLQDLTNAPQANYQASPEYPFPKVPGNTRPLPFHPDIIGTILSLLSDQKVEIVATLVTSQTVHKQALPLEATEFGEHTLLVRATNASLELDLESIQALHLSFRADRAPQIYASGPDKIQLICIEPSSNPLDIAALNGLLSELVPELM